MKGWQYRLIILGLVLILGGLAVYSFTLTQGLDSLRRDYNKCQSEKNMRLGPEYKEVLDTCDADREELQAELENFKDEFSKYCGMFSLITPSADVPAGGREVHTVRFGTSVNLPEVPYKLELNHCSEAFKSLMNNAAFYAGGKNHDCAAENVARDGYNLNMSCVCGYYVNPVTDVILPAEV